MSFDDTNAPAFPGHSTAVHYLLREGSGKVCRVQVLDDTGDDRVELKAYDGAFETGVLLTPGEAIRLSLSLALAALRGYRRA